MSLRMVGVGRACWYTKKDGSPVDIQALVNLVADIGANCWREALINSVTDSWLQTVLVPTANMLRAKGIKHIIQTNGTTGWSVSAQEETNILNNVNGAQTDWINKWGHIIDVVQPYAIMVMNEPGTSVNLQTPTATQFAAYRQFCVNCINAWRQIKPDLVIIVQNQPFNDLFDSTTYGFAADPLPYPDVIYARHEYYSYDATYPPSYKPEHQAYWNAKTEQDLANAKLLLAQHIDDESKALRAKGQAVMWDEMGANVTVPNAGLEVRDFLLICEGLGIGAIYYNLAPSSYEPCGLLSDDYTTFNPVGLVIATAIEQTAPPPITTYALTILGSVEGGTTNPLAGIYMVDAGADFTVTAIPNQGYNFSKWMLDGIDQTAWWPTVQFTVWNIAGDHTLYAIFESIPPPTPPPPKYTSSYIAYASGVSQTDIAILRVFGHRCLPNELIDFYDWCGPHLARLLKYQSIKNTVRTVIEWLVCQLKKNLTL